MHNIELKLAKPYQREAAAVAPHKVEFEAEFSDIMEALSFMRDLNDLIISYNQPDDIMNEICSNFVARENRKDA